METRKFASWSVLAFLKLLCSDVFKQTNVQISGSQPFVVCELLLETQHQWFPAQQ